MIGADAEPTSFYWAASSFQVLLAAF